MNRPARKLFSFLSAVAMLCSLPPVPAGAAYTAEQIGPDFDGMIRGKDQNIYFQDGTAETVKGGTQLVVIGSDGEKQLVDLPEGISGLNPYCSASIDTFNFLSPTPAAYSFDFFDPAFGLGSDQDVFITETEDGYALCDLEGNLRSASYSALTYMGEGFYIDQLPPLYKVSHSPTVTVINASGKEIFRAEDGITSCFLTLDGKNFLVKDETGAFFTDLTGKQVSQTYPEIYAETQSFETESGYGVYFRLLDDVYFFENKDQKWALSFGGEFAPTTAYRSRYDKLYGYDWEELSERYYYGYDREGEAFNPIEGSMVFYDAQGNQLPGDPRGSRKPDPIRFVHSIDCRFDHSTGEVSDYDGNVYFTAPEGAASVNEFVIGDKTYFTVWFDTYFMVYDAAGNVLQEHIDGYYAGFDLPLWFCDQPDSWYRIGDNPVHFGFFLPDQGVVYEPVYSMPRMIPEVSHYCTQIDKSVVIMDWDGTVLHEFVNDYSYSSVSFSAYEPLVVNGTDAKSGERTSVVYDAYTDQVLYQQTGQYDYVQSAAGDYAVVTNFDDANVSLWTNDTIYRQGLIRFDGSEVIAPTNELFITLDSTNLKVNKYWTGLALDSTYYDKQERDVYAVIRNHPKPYDDSPYALETISDGVYVDIDAIDPQYAADQGFLTAARLSDGHYAVISGGKWGLADEAGTLLHAPSYDAIYEYRDGLGLASVDGMETVHMSTYDYEMGESVTVEEERIVPHVGVICSSGKELIAPFYNDSLESSQLSKVTCAFKCRDSATLYFRQGSEDNADRASYWDMTAETVNNTMTETYGYDAAEAFGDLYLVRKDGCMGIVTADNSVVLPVEFAKVLYFNATPCSLVNIHPTLGSSLSQEAFTAPMQKLDDGTLLVSVETMDGKVQAYRIREAGAASGLIGDLNGDGKVDAGDATEILIASAKMGAGLDSGLTAQQMALADVNGDGEVNAGDASEVLQFAAAVGAGENVTPESYFARLSA